MSDEIEFLPIFDKSETHSVMKPKMKPPFITGDWNTMTKKVFEKGGFVEAFIWRLQTERDNAVIIEGERGEGKTNVLLFFISLFNLFFKVPFTVNKNVYLGRDVDLTVNWIAKDFKELPFSSIGIDEAEIPFSRYTAITIQNREAKIFMDTFRELFLGVFFVCPDKEILDQRIVDRCNWNIIADWNDKDNQCVEVTIEYYGKSKDRTRFKWLKYEELMIPYVNEDVYEQLRMLKHADLYSSAGLKKSFADQRKIKLEQVKKSKKIEQAMRVNAVVGSKADLDDKMLGLFKLELPKYRIEALLKEEGATKARVELMEHFYLTELAEKLENVKE
jgi:hypothetical protein